MKQFGPPIPGSLPYRLKPGSFRHFERDEDGNTVTLSPGDILWMTEARFRGLADRFEYAPDVGLEDNDDETDDEAPSDETDDDETVDPADDDGDETPPVDDTPPTDWSAVLDDLPFRHAVQRVTEIDTIDDLIAAREAEEGGRNRRSVLAAVDRRLDELTG